MVLSNTFFQLPIFQDLLQLQRIRETVDPVLPLQPLVYMKLAWPRQELLLQSLISLSNIWLTVVMMESK